jgi:pyruvate/2-oxoglutarate dehydrogenase complex dihydrolipoamide dehydrogenase (E3) component
MYRRFGSEVTVIELASRLIAREDEDISQAVAGFLMDERSIASMITPATS